MEEGRKIGRGEGHEGHEREVRNVSEVENEGV